MTRPTFDCIWPPTDLIESWWGRPGEPPARDLAFLVWAYRAGAKFAADKLAPQPPTLKEQALQLLEYDTTTTLDRDDVLLIRRALLEAQP